MSFSHCQSNCLTYRCSYMILAMWTWSLNWLGFCFTKILGNLAPSKDLEVGFCSMEAVSDVRVSFASGRMLQVNPGQSAVVLWRAGGIMIICSLDSSDQPCGKPATGTPTDRRPHPCLGGPVTSMSGVKWPYCRNQDLMFASLAPVGFWLHRQQMDEQSVPSESCLSRDSTGWKDAMFESGFAFLVRELRGVHAESPSGFLMQALRTQPSVLPLTRDCWGLQGDAVCWLGPVSQWDSDFLQECKVQPHT